jgi:hypothetical protein
MCGEIADAPLRSAATKVRGWILVKAMWFPHIAARETHRRSLKFSFFT